MDSSSTGKGPEAPGPKRPRDRRATHRAAIEIPAVLHVGTREVGCSIRDLSTRGIALVVRESLAPGMVVRVGFRLPNSRQAIDVAGVLVRAAGGRGQSTLGLEFVEPDADTVRTIRTFVERNRSDSPFSQRRRRGPDTLRVTHREQAEALRGIYQKAVGDKAKTGKRRSLLDRLLGRDKR